MRRLQLANRISQLAMDMQDKEEEEREDGADENDEEDGNSISAFPKPPPSVASSGRGAGGARKIEKNFFLSVESIQYNREIGAAVLPCSSTQQSSRSQQQVIPRL